MQSVVVNPPYTDIFYISSCSNMNMFVNATLLINLICYPYNLIQNVTQSTFYFQGSQVQVCSIFSSVKQEVQYMFTDTCPDNCKYMIKLSYLIPAITGGIVFGFICFLGVVWIDRCHHNRKQCEKLIDYNDKTYQATSYV
jgi:hypothetical protein